jgi:hypothetical protein
MVIGIFITGRFCTLLFLVRETEANGGIIFGREPEDLSRVGFARQRDRLTSGVQNLERLTYGYFFKLAAYVLSHGVSKRPN